MVKIKGNIAKLFKQEIIHERIVPEEVLILNFSSLDSVSLRLELRSIIFISD